MRAKYPISTNSIIIVVFLFFATLCLFISANSASMASCNEKETQALLHFKQSLLDPANRLSSWSITEDCCGWAGVRCDNVSGHVIELHLGNSYHPYSFGSFATTSDFGRRFDLGGEISPALLLLEHLQFLSLSLNDFGGAPIPSFLGSMRNLTILSLWGASFAGLIPHQLGNLSALRHLDLGGNPGLYVDNLSWISGLSSLEFLYMSEVDLHRDVHWLDSLAPLSSLSVLYLPNCQLNNMFSSPVGYVNFTSLTHLYLDSNNFSHNVPNWLFNLSSLSRLDLSDNSLQGQIPSTVANLQSLNYLNLSVNMLTGQIPQSLAQLKLLQSVSLFSNSLSGPIPSQLGNISALSYLVLHSNKLNGFIPSQLGNLSYLSYLYLQNNRLNGPIPSQLGNMSYLSYLCLYINELNGSLPRNLGLLPNLVYLNIGDNSIGGMVSEVNFAKLSKLKYLDMSNTYVVFNISDTWIPPFQLEYIQLTGCKVGPRIPAWLRTQTSLQMLSLYGGGIVGTVPKWFWNWASNIQMLHLGYNQISGDLSHVLINNTVFSADGNRFVGQLPRLSPNVVWFDMSINSLSGQLSSFLCQKMNGSRSKLALLELFNNSLSGELGDCFMGWQSLTRLNLGSNNLSGKIPESIGSLFSLKTLHLYNNGFSGGIPLSLRNCTSLGLIDLAENKLTGNIPSWIGESTTRMLAIRLRSNEFFGDIPQQICRLSSLIVLDLADNRLSGSIPRCLSNMSAMATVPSPIHDNFSTLRENIYTGYSEDLLLVIKGRESDYYSILPLVRAMDLSRNNLSGEIPTEISRLFGLQSLNLSGNHLVGRIPETVGGIQYLESLDLSNNHLSGEIPESITNLTFLNHLDLSYNNLSGKIPSSTQLQSFNDVDFTGNPELCGAPLSKRCRENELGPDNDEGGVKKKKNHHPSGSSDEDAEISLWFYIGGTSGFVVGFWGVCLSLLCKRSWRHAYFHFLNNINHRIYVATALTKINSFTRLPYSLRRSRE